MPFLPTALAVSAVLGPLAGMLAHRIVRRWPEELPLFGAPLPCPVCGRPPGGGVRRSFSWRRACGHGPDPWALLGMAGFTAAFALLAVTEPHRSWFGWSQSLLLVFLLYPLSAIDIRTMTVEVRLVALGLLLRMAALAIFEPAQLLQMMAGLLIGAGFFHMLDLLYEVVRKRRGLGEGDAAVAALVGAFVGWEGLAPAIGLAALAGLAVGLAWIVIARRSLSAPIPFTPFLALGGLVVYLAGLHGGVVLFPVWPPLR